MLMSILAAKIDINMLWRALRARKMQNGRI